jgi:hypothetical protein
VMNESSWDTLLLAVPVECSTRGLGLLWNQSMLWLMMKKLDH